MRSLETNSLRNGASLIVLTAFLFRSISFDALPFFVYGFVPRAISAFMLHLFNDAFLLI